MSNIGKALDKVTRRGDGGGDDYRRGFSSGKKQKPFKYQDKVVNKREQSKYQIGLMRQDRVFKHDELHEYKIITQTKEYQYDLNTIKEMRDKFVSVDQSASNLVVVTSVTEDDNIDFLARNLATVIAADDSNTALIVECMPSHPSMVVSANDNINLVNYVNQDYMEVSEVVCQTGVPRVRCVPFGNTNSVNNDILRNTRLRVLIKELSKRYPDRYIIIQAPPIGKNADVAMLVEMAHHVILSVPYGKTYRSDLDQVMDKIDPEKLIGYIVTGAVKLPSLLTKIVGL